MLYYFIVVLVYNFGADSSVSSRNLYFHYMYGFISEEGYGDTRFDKNPLHFCVSRLEGTLKCNQYADIASPDYQEVMRQTPPILLTPIQFLLDSKQR